MVNSKINLLSDSKKTKLEQMVRFLFVKNLLELSLITLAALATILLWSWILLNQQFNDLIGSALSVNQSAYTYNYDIKNINRLTKGIMDSSNGYLDVGPYLTEFIKNTPANIKVNSLSIDRTTGDLVISGTAKDRTTLLSYQNILNNLSWVKNFQLPFSQLLQKENINFELRATISGWPALRRTPNANPAKTLKNQD